MAITSNRRRFILRAAVASALALALAGASAAPAYAGPQHQGTDPAATGCNVNASQIATRAVQDELGHTVATVQVFYSNSCQTNWIRVTGNPAGGTATKDIRAAGGSWLPTESDYGTGSSYSMQVYAPGSTCVNFNVHLYYPSGASYGETYSAGATYQTVC